MSDGTAIEWTDATWNPVRGCTKISPGCKHCYAETFSERFRGVPGHPFEHGFDLQLVEKAIELPLRWKHPRRIFVNSMSDLFHDAVPEEFVRRVFDTMRRAPQHSFQLLTKRSARLADVASRLEVPKNVWVGVSVENQRYTRRIADLQSVDAQVRFLSVEPLLSPIERLPLDGIHWVIVGGESGPRARRIDPAWVRSIRDQCLSRNVAFFFKQWGGVRKKITGRTLDSRTWNEMPSAPVATISAARRLVVVA